ncbi:hypothetical protein Efla_005079 [Eimeria flavescens]
MDSCAQRQQLACLLRVFVTAAAAETTTTTTTAAAEELQQPAAAATSAAAATQQQHQQQQQEQQELQQLQQLQQQHRRATNSSKMGQAESTEEAPLAAPRTATKEAGKQQTPQKRGSTASTASAVSADAEDEESPHPQAAGAAAQGKLPGQLLRPKHKQQRSQQAYPQQLQQQDFECMHACVHACVAAASGPRWILFCGFFAGEARHQHQHQRHNQQQQQHAGEEEGTLEEYMSMGMTGIKRLFTGSMFPEGGEAAAAEKPASAESPVAAAAKEEQEEQEQQGPFIVPTRKLSHGGNPALAALRRDQQRRAGGGKQQKAAAAGQAEGAAARRAAAEMAAPGAAANAAAKAAGEGRSGGGPLPPTTLVGSRDSQREAAFAAEARREQVELMAEESRKSNEARMKKEAEALAQAARSSSRQSEGAPPQNPSQAGGGMGAPEAPPPEGEGGDVNRIGEVLEAGKDVAARWGEGAPANKTADGQAADEEERMPRDDDAYKAHGGGRVEAALKKQAERELPADAFPPVTDRALQAEARREREAAQNSHTPLNEGGPPSEGDPSGGGRKKKAAKQAAGSGGDQQADAAAGKQQQHAAAPLSREISKEELKKKLQHEKQQQQRQKQHAAADAAEEARGGPSAADRTTGSKQHAAAAAPLSKEISEEELREKLQNAQGEREEEGASAGREAAAEEQQTEAAANREEAAGQEETHGERKTQHPAVHALRHHTQDPKEEAPLSREAGKEEFSDLLHAAKQTEKKESASREKLEAVKHHTQDPKGEAPLSREAGKEEFSEMLHAAKQTEKDESAWREKLEAVKHHTQDPKEEAPLSREAGKEEFREMLHAAKQTEKDESAWREKLEAVKHHTQDPKGEAPLSREAGKEEFSEMLHAAKQTEKDESALREKLEAVKHHTQDPKGEAPLSREAGKEEFSEMLHAAKQTEKEAAAGRQAAAGEKARGQTAAETAAEEGETSEGRDWQQPAANLAGHSRGEEEPVTRAMDKEEFLRQMHGVKEEEGDTAAGRGGDSRKETEDTQQGEEGMQQASKPTGKEEPLKARHTLSRELSEDGLKKLLQRSKAEAEEARVGKGQPEEEEMPLHAAEKEGEAEQHKKTEDEQGKRGAPPSREHSEGKPGKPLHQQKEASADRLKDTAATPKESAAEEEEGEASPEAEGGEGHSHSAAGRSPREQTEAQQPLSREISKEGLQQVLRERKEREEGGIRGRWEEKGEEEEAGKGEGEERAAAAARESHDEAPPHQTDKQEISSEEFQKMLHKVREEDEEAEPTGGAAAAAGKGGDLPKEQQSKQKTAAPLSREQSKKGVEKKLQKRPSAGATIFMQVGSREGGKTGPATAFGSTVHPAAAKKTGSHGQTTPFRFVAKAAEAEPHAGTPAAAAAAAVVAAAEAMEAAHEATHGGRASSFGTQHQLSRGMSHATRAPTNPSALPSKLGSKNGASAELRLNMTRISTGLAERLLLIIHLFAFYSMADEAAQKAGFLPIGPGATSALNAALTGSPDFQIRIHVGFPPPSLLEDMQANESISWFQAPVEDTQDTLASLETSCSRLSSPSTQCFPGLQSLLGEGPPEAAAAPPPSVSQSECFLLFSFNGIANEWRMLLRLLPHTRWASASRCCYLSAELTSFSLAFLLFFLQQYFSRGHQLKPSGLSSGRASERPLQPPAMGLPARSRFAAAAAAAAAILCFVNGLSHAAPEINEEAAAGSLPEFDIEWPGRVVAVGDLHGDAENALLLLDALGVVDKKTRRWKGGDTLLVQTGDIVDRGPDGKLLYDLFAEWKKEAREAGGKVVTLIGNHDAMNVCGDFRYVHPKETAQFGGLSSRRLAFSERGKYGSLLLSLASAVRINGIIFSHAGVTPPFAALGLSRLHELLTAELRDGCSLYYKKQRGLEAVDSLFASGEDGPLWSRLYTLSPPHIGCPALKEALNLLAADAMVVGHTVQESLRVETHCAGRLVAIDTGVSRYVANSPRALEVTPTGDVYEVAVHPIPGAGDEEETHKTQTRKLRIQPLRFYKQRQQHQKQQKQQQQQQQQQAAGEGVTALVIDGAEEL